MGTRPYEERVAEVQRKRAKTAKRLAQYDEQRKQRTHSLIVCGAEIAALFDRVLDQDEIYTVVNFLREQRELGNFTLEKTDMAAEETAQETTEKAKDDFGDLFGGFFDF